MNQPQHFGTAVRRAHKRRGVAAKMDADAPS